MVVEPSVIRKGNAGVRPDGQAAIAGIIHVDAGVGLRVQRGRAGDREGLGRCGIDRDILTNAGRQPEALGGLRSAERWLVGKGAVEERADRG